MTTPSHDISPPLAHHEKANIKKQNLTVSVWLGGNVNAKRLIRCIYCSRVLSEVTGEVKQITAGDSQPGLGAVAIIVQCSDCKTKYSLMD